MGGINSWPIAEKNVLRQTSGSMFEWDCYTIHPLDILLHPNIHSKGGLHQSIARVTSSGSANLALKGIRLVLDAGRLLAHLC